MITFFDIKWRKKAKNGNSTVGRVCFFCGRVRGGVRKWRWWVEGEEVVVWLGLGE